MTARQNSKPKLTAEAAYENAHLVSQILREIQKQGKDARFKKAERGKFVANA